MSQSLVRNAVHIIFSTKHRYPFIQSQIESELYSYLGATCNELDSQVIKIGGYTDHVHILCLLSKKIALMKLVEEVKTGSSKWMKTNGAQYENFYWQNGYGAFSVNSNELDGLIRYIENQHAHHSRIGFQNEYRKILKDLNVDYDERYIWD